MTEQVKWRGTVKIQWPLASNEPEPACLVYNKSRSVLMTTPANDEMKAIMNGEPKVYAKALITTDNRLLVQEVIGQQAW